jgi:hypothetical protein
MLQIVIFSSITFFDSLTILTDLGLQYEQLAYRPSYAGEWSSTELLEHTNTIRWNITDLAVSPMKLAATSLILGQLLCDERSSSSRIDLATIAYTRLDKLLQDLLDVKRTMCVSRPPGKVFETASSLQLLWQARFLGRCGFIWCPGNGKYCKSLTIKNQLCYY